MRAVCRWVKLDRLVLDARRRRFDFVVVWSLDRLGRSLKHLVVMLDDLQALDPGFISIREGAIGQRPVGGCKRSCSR